MQNLLYAVRKLQPERLARELCEYAARRPAVAGPAARLVVDDGRRAARQERLGRAAHAHGAVRERARLPYDDLRPEGELRQPVRDRLRRGPQHQPAADDAAAPREREVPRRQRRGCLLLRWPLLII